MNAKIGVLWIFGNFGLRDTFQERIAPKSIETEINMDKLRKEIVSIKRRFRSDKLSPAEHSIVGQYFEKTVADHHGHTAYHNKH